MAKRRYNPTQKLARKQSKLVTQAGQLGKTRTGVKGPVERGESLFTPPMPKPKGVK